MSVRVLQDLNSPLHKQIWPRVSNVQLDSCRLATSPGAGFLENADQCCQVWPGTHHSSDTCPTMASQATLSRPTGDRATKLLRILRLCTTSVSGTVDRGLLTWAHLQAGHRQQPPCKPEAHSGTDPGQETCSVFCSQRVGKAGVWFGFVLFPDKRLNFPIFTTLLK